MNYDIIIVGAGSAGCVMANRLSEDRSRSVLLIEAGPVFFLDAYPAEVLDANQYIRTGQFTWGYSTEAGEHSPAFPVAAGRVSGGGSTINAANIVRGRPDDFERWARLGVTGWSYDDILETYVGMERRAEDAGANHAHTGPVPIRRYDSTSSTQTLRAFVSTFAQAGYEEMADINDHMRRGITLGSRNVVKSVRVNAGLAYLTPAVRDRSNLTILERTQVDAVQFDAQRAVGVRLADGRVVFADEVVLCSGVYGSPTLLMRSGVGPAAHLRSLDIPIVVDLPVGCGLRDHPAFFSTYALKEGVSDVDPACGPVLATSSSRSDGKDLDLWVFANNMKAPPWQKGSAMLIVGAAVMRPASRGSVRLKSRDPADRPVIDFELLSAPSDRSRLLEAVRLGRWAARTTPLADLIAKETGPLAGIADDDDSLMQAIEAAVSTFDHGCCTARMGAAGDPLAVTDRSGNVQQLEGLRVVDASIFPDTLSVPINLTTMMLAERISAEMRGAAASHRPVTNRTRSEPMKSK